MTYIPPPRSNGTIQTTRLKQPWDQGRPFRILAIDGGGIRGIFPAALLAEIERRFLNGQSIGYYFDMIAGTSTGGIIALALAHGLTAAGKKTLAEDAWRNLALCLPEPALPHRAMGMVRSQGAPLPTSADQDAVVRAA